MQGTDTEDDPWARASTEGSPITKSASRGTFSAGSVDGSGPFISVISALNQSIG
jgi:hypothetical protein